MNTIQHTYELPHGLYRMVLVADEAEARHISPSGYLYHSRVIAALYLFVPQAEG